jgi:hypothetical protein
VTSAEKHVTDVTAAYLVVLAVVLLYVVLYAFELRRLEREVAASCSQEVSRVKGKEDPARAVHDGEA